MKFLVLAFLITISLESIASGPEANFDFLEKQTIELTSGGKVTIGDIVVSCQGGVSNPSSAAKTFTAVSNIYVSWPCSLATGDGETGRAFGDIVRTQLPNEAETNAMDKCEAAGYQCKLVRKGYKSKEGVTYGCIGYATVEGTK